MKRYFDEIIKIRPELMMSKVPYQGYYIPDASTTKWVFDYTKDELTEARERVTNELERLKLLLSDKNEGARTFYIDSILDELISTSVDCWSGITKFDDTETKDLLRFHRMTLDEVIITLLNMSIRLKLPLDVSRLQVWDERCPVLSYYSIYEAMSKPQKCDSTKQESSFIDIIQHEDKDALLERLHFLIDGKRAVDIAAVINKAILDKHLIRKPTKSEFKSEFDISCSWEGIRKNLEENVTKNMSAYKAAQNVVIF